MLPIRKLIRTSVLLAVAVCLIAGCAGTKPALVPSGALRTVPAADEQAFDAFFTRWNAYTRALADGAQDMKEVYADLSDLSSSWQEGSYTESADGPSVVALYLPFDSGTITLRAGNGEISSGTVSWQTEEERDVSATLASMVACNALAYGLSAGADAGAAQGVYTSCARTMARDADGTLTGGPQYLGGYGFTLILDPDIETTTFVGVRA